MSEGVAALVVNYVPFFFDWSWIEEETKGVSVSYNIQGAALANLPAEPRQNGISLRFKLTRDTQAIGWFIDQVIEALDLAVQLTYLTAITTFEATTAGTNFFLLNAYLGKTVYMPYGAVASMNVSTGGDTNVTELSIELIALQIPYDKITDAGSIVL